MPRFVVLEHDWPEPHLDLFLDAGTELQAWKLSADFDPAVPALIQQNAPHRRQYLDYEGVLAGDRGSVRRWDFGEFEWLGLRGEFHGQKLQGVYEWHSAESGEWIFRRVT